MKEIEFGRSGTEGIKHENTFEHIRWSSLKNEPFAGDDISRRAEEINKQLETIELEDDKLMNSDASLNKKTDEESAEQAIASLKQNLHNIFGSASSHSQDPNMDNNNYSRPVAPRTPPMEAVTDVNGDPFYPMDYYDSHSDTAQILQPEKTDAEKGQIKAELEEVTAQVREQLNQRHPNEPKFWHNEPSDELQGNPSQIDKIEQMQQSMNSDILGIIKEMERRRQSNSVPDFDWEMDKKDPQYRKEWEEKRKIAEQNVGNKIVDIEGVYNWGGDYRASVVSGDGSRTMEKITKEQYDLLSKQFPEENTDGTISSMQDQHVPNLSEQAGQGEVSQEKLAEQESQVTPETNLSIEADDTLLKNQTINQIVSKMLDAGEFQNYGLDINQKMRDIEYTKKKLQDKTLEELQLLLSTYD